MDNCTICSVCKKSKLNSEFINKNGKCYKCVYHEKIVLLAEREEEAKKRVFCKNCRQKLPCNRWAYCCDACALKAKRSSRHWTVSLKYDSTNWKRRFIF